MEDLVSIVTPVFGGENSLLHAVKSVLAQTHEHWEMHIIADDGVDYQALLGAHGIDDPRLYFGRTPKQRSGPNVGRNIALSQARGQWVAPLDADDVYYPRRLELLLGAAARTGLSLDNIKIVGASLEPRVVIDASARVDAAGTEIGLEFVRECLVPLLFLFHREHIKYAWDEDIERGADTIFNLRALERAGSAVFVAEPLHEYRVHEKSMCHAEGAESIFDQAYQHTIDRLTLDGLGFVSDQFRLRVTNMIESKRAINRAFSQAVKCGYSGNYQSFVTEQQMC